MHSQKRALRLAVVIASSTTTGLAGYFFGKRKSDLTLTDSEIDNHGGASTTKLTNVCADNSSLLNKSCTSVVGDYLSQAVPSFYVQAKTQPQLPVVPLSTGDIGSGVPNTKELVRHGFPSTENLRSYQDFMLSYDKRNRAPNWVLEHLTPEKVNKSLDAPDRSKMAFKEDESFHIFHRATNNDFKGSGYDRGHLAAAANHRHSHTAMAQTFILSNITPQVGEGFNRSAWNNLEKYVRAIARKSKNVYICTGPLYLSRKEPSGKLYVKYEVIGPNHVAVPTHFFKVLVIENDQGQLDLQSYVMPNEVLPDVKLHAYLTPLEVIERAAGLNFFPNIPKSTFRRINSKYTS